MQKNTYFFLALLPILLFACSKPEPTGPFVFKQEGETITLYAGERYRLTVNQPVESWKLENEFVAEVSADGVVTGKHIGTTKLYVTAAGEEEPDYSCTIDVIPCYNTYYEPIFSSSVEFVRSHESRKEIEPEIPYSLEFVGDRQWVQKIAYQLYPSEKYEEGIVRGAMVFILKIKQEEVVKFLEERYTSSTYSNGDIVYYNDVENYGQQITARIVPHHSDENSFIVLYRF